MSDAADDQVIPPVLRNMLGTNHFRFTAQEIESARATPLAWTFFVRNREAEMIFSLFPNHQFEHALEIGAGSGAQSVLLARYCRRLVCTEIDPASHAYQGISFLERRTPNVEYLLCDAQDLSRFADNTFDLVFSSNVLEYIPDVVRALKECRRVLRPDGIMIHFMPGRTWKTFSFFLTYVRLSRPGAHGAHGSNLRDFYEFGPRVWARRFQQTGLVLHRRVAMPFYPGQGNRFIRVTKLGNLLGLSASFAYILYKP